MEKYLRLFIILGWFFTTEMVYEKDAKTRSLIGPFKTQELCEKETDFVKQKIDEVGWQVSIGKCRYVQEV